MACDNEAIALYRSWVAATNRYLPLRVADEDIAQACTRLELLAIYVDRDTTTVVEAEPDPWPISWRSSALEGFRRASPMGQFTSKGISRSATLYSMIIRLTPTTNRKDPVK